MISTHLIPKKTDDFFSIVRGRRSISEFADMPIVDDVIDELIRVSGYAPSGTDIQPWFFLVVRTETGKAGLIDLIAKGYEETKRRLISKKGMAGPMFGLILDAFAKYGKFDTAPAYILAFSRPYDKAFLSRVIELSGDSDIANIADESAKTSVAMAMQNLLLTAHAMGLGTRVKDGIKFFLNDSELKREFFQLFSIPSDYRLISGIQLGYPTESALRRKASPRLSLDSIRRYA